MNEWINELVYEDLSWKQLIKKDKVYIHVSKSVSTRKKVEAPMLVHFEECSHYFSLALTCIRSYFQNNVAKVPGQLPSFCKDLLDKFGIM